MKKELKPTLAIIDLTDCEGCQLELISFKERLLDLSDKVEFVEWRLAQDRSEALRQNFDVVIIEGTPITSEEIELVKEIRERAGIVVALGSCAAIGGVNSILNQSEREAAKNKIYNSEYRLKATDSRPLSAHIKVDVVIPGCPVSGSEAEEVLGKLVHGFFPRPKSYTVCMECKAKQNRCLLLENLPCMGPVTRGGCGALCLSHGIPCYGCWGKLDGTNVEALKKKFKEFMSEEEIGKRFRIYWRNENSNVKTQNSKLSPKLKIQKI
ncbi:hypothetical protein KJ596_00665 [Patescibacteria group bacterium]|nr:hypothetical protein [Patescibacteria group bacterium]